MTHLHKLSIAAFMLACVALVGGCQHGQGVDLGYEAGELSLSEAEVARILDKAEEAAGKEASLLRVDAQGKTQMTRMHIIVVDRAGAVIGRRSMADAWGGSVAIAKAKAYTAVAFSSNENALTTRSLGPLTQPGGPLWNIGNSNANGGNPGLIEFPGGMPLYKDGVLVGAIGVSGDGVEQDENVAEAATAGYAPPKAIRIDTVTDGGVPYSE
ncbi:MAG: GlcG/HbpS family heme-binding protein [Phycisphaeraceae bacterium]